MAHWNLTGTLNWDWAREEYKLAGLGRLALAGQQLKGISTGFIMLKMMPHQASIPISRCSSAVTGSRVEENCCTAQGTFPISKNKERSRPVDPRRQQHVAVARQEFLYFYTLFVLIFSANAKFFYGNESNAHMIPSSLWGASVSCTCKELSFRRGWDFPFEITF